MNLNQSESIWPRIHSDWFWLKIRFWSIRVQIENLVSDWFGFIRIVTQDLIGLGRIDFLPFFIKRDTKRFSDWFGMIRIGSDMDIGINQNRSDWLGMIRIGSDTDIGMNQNSSDWLGMNFYLIKLKKKKKILIV